ncbi:MAG TPA: alpha/beta hydrolase [Terriglobales bacterium]|nr:alpha/beta hydrolase [Terriglobales bacterium]
MLPSIGRAPTWVLILSSLVIYSGCNACDGNKNHDQGAAQQPKSFYERRDNAARVIVFVHGIFGSSFDTWNCSPKISWPKLLRDDDAFKDSDIYIAGYDTPYLGNKMTIDEVVSNLKSRLDSDEVFTKHREVVFVAHSLGGLIVQRFLLTHRELARQVPFIYFFSTPETGAQIAQLGHLFSQDPLLKEMFPGNSNDYLLNLESEWRNAGFAIHRYCAYEKQPLSGVLVVDRLSGTRSCERVVAINENHSTIVKPCDRNVDSYIALRNAVKDNPIAPEKIPTTTVTENRKWSAYQQVDCNRTNSQTLTASITLDPQHEEKVISASASLEGADNIQGVTGPTLGAVSGNTVPVTYGFNGKDKDMLGNCPGGGHATVVVTFVVQKQVPVR